MAVNEDKIAKHRWKPGQSGNPRGRPKLRPLSDRYREALEFPIPETDRKKLGLPKGARVGDAIARAMALRALKGSVDAARELADRTEGRAHQRTSVDARTTTAITTTPLIEVNFVDPPNKPNINAVLPKAVPSAAPAILPPAESEPSVAEDKDDGTPKCEHCGLAIDERTHGKLRRWFHTATNEFYCRPEAASDMRVAKPKREKRNGNSD